MSVLRQVAKTDTFEKQRQVINDIASDLFSIGAGGSDLSTGNLKLGDGTKDAPSLSFLSQGTLGLFRPEQNNMTFVADTKRIFAYDASAAYFYRNFILQKNELITEGLELQNIGQNYDPGSYNNISVFGGTGASGEVALTIVAYSGSVTNSGSGYSYPSTGGLGGGGSEVFNNVEFTTSGSGTGVKGNVTHANGSLTEVEFTDFGSGYAIGDTLGMPPDVVSVTATTTTDSADITLSDTTGIYEGWEIIVVNTSGGGSLETPTDALSGAALPIKVQSLSAMNTTDLTTNTVGLTDGTITVTFRAPWDNVNGSGFQYTIDKVGVANAVSVDNSGNGYTVGDVLTINPLDLTQPIDLTVSTIGVQQLTFASAVSGAVVGASVEATDPNSGGGGGGGGAGGGLGGGGGGTDPNVGTIIEVNSSTDFVVRWTTGNASSGYEIAINGSGAFVIDSLEERNRFGIDLDDGNGEQLYPDLTFFKNNRYRFDITNVGSSHPLRLSIHPDGIHNVVSQTISLSDSSLILNVPSVAGILVGMSVASNNDDISQTGQITGATVVSVDPVGNTVTVDALPNASGTSIVEFTGVQYSGSEYDAAEDDSNYVVIAPTDETPATLYYYCENHPDMAGNDGNEAEITINYNNPKVFGTGLEILVTEVQTTDTVKGDVSNGNFEVQEITGTTVTVEDITTTNITSELSTTDRIKTPILSLEQNSDGSDLTTITAIAGAIDLGGTSFKIGDKFTVTGDTGTINTDGIIKTTNQLNVNDYIKITDNNIESTLNNNIFLTPAPNKIVKVDATTALCVPAGVTSQRPTSANVQNGSIRFNSETNQYEGYSDLSGSGIWSSLGGVRDVDGNTYITAEAFVGANDNTLYFYTDDNNAARLNNTYLDFWNTKKIRSANTTAPSYFNYAPNIPLTVGQYVKYRNNIYEVTGSGTSATSGNEPTHTTGAQANGSAELTWHSLAVAPLTFEEIEEIRIAPVGGTALSINGDLRLENARISTDISDLTIDPNSGKRVIINAATHLQIPAGTEGQKSTGTAQAGSIRYNTTILQYEGYNGSSWSSLGGVRDVDGDTYIKPEVSPGSDEDTLYFYNTNVLSMQLTPNKLELLAVDSFESADNINLNAPTITTHNLATTLDTDDALRARFTTIRSEYEIGFNPTGLANETFLRFNENGEVWINRGLGSGGTESYLRVLDSDLETFELERTRQNSVKVPLERGVVNSGTATIYNPTTALGAKVHLIAFNKTTGDKESIEYSVIDKGTNIEYTELGNLKTGANIIDTAFNFAVSGEVRLTMTLNTALAQNNLIDVIVVTNAIKK